MHRGRIRTPDGTQWLTVPIHPDDRKKEIREVRLHQEKSWIANTMKVLEYNYRNSLYFDFYEPEIQRLLSGAMEMDRFYKAAWHMASNLMKFAEFPMDVEWIHDSETLEETLKRHQGETILVEPGSGYYRRRLPGQMEANSIVPEYRQHFGGFFDGCCLLDVLFGYGPESFKVLDRLKIASLPG